MAQGAETADGKELVRGSPRRSQQHGAPICRGDAPQATVLLVDDEEPVRETLVEVLSSHSYHVITADSVAEAEEAKERIGVEGIHLLITDIHLTPGRQVRAGYALAQRWGNLPRSRPRSSWQVKTEALARPEPAAGPDQGILTSSRRIDGEVIVA
jgi:CheY-like chemotaxis protein